MALRILLLALILSIPATLRAETSAEKAGFASRLTIYLAKGAPNSCGAGCDHWIAVEGEVDRDSAARVRRFLAGIKDTQRPIYFHSPGGNVEQSYVIGRLLRGRKAIARVGKTIVPACAAGTQVDAACLKIKNAGGEIEAELTTRNAMCNSACGYLFLGATTREVAPDAAMAVHNSKLTLVIRGNPPPQMVADYRQRQLASADRDRAAFVATMGINRELNDLIKTVKFESLHVLTRPELYRFGIDTRPLVETSWTLEKETRPYIRKIATVRKEDGASFRMMEWRLFCENQKRVPLMFVGEVDEAASGKSTVLMAADSNPNDQAGGLAQRVGKYEVWSGGLGADMVTTIMASRSLQVRETTPMPNGKADSAKFDIDLTGLASVWTQLSASCAPAPAAAKSPWPTGPSPSVSAAPPSKPAP
jgi:hypothetical protein